MGVAPKGFDYYVEITPTCHLWKGGKAGSGYGSFKEDGINYSSHVYAFRRAGGVLADGELVRHTCDVKLCVNPAHLIPGTPKDNAQDAVERGGYQRGSNHYCSRFTDEQLADVRSQLAAGVRQKDIAAQYGVVKGTISHIATGRNRK